MSSVRTETSTIADLLWPVAKSSKITRFIILVVLGSALLTISAKIKVPFYPVPMTMQTAVVLALPALLGFRIGVTAVAFYLLQGALGVPVFTGTPEKGIGLAYMMGPTGGYLLGFLLAAGLIGWFADRGMARSVIATGGVMVAAQVIIFGFGLLWLGTLLGWDKPILEFGLYPFIVGDLAKTVLAVCVVTATWSVAKRFRA